MTDHIQESVLERFALVPDEFVQKERDFIKQHISECACCRETWADFCNLYQNVSKELKSPPSERDLSLAGKLLARKGRSLPARLLELPKASEKALGTFVQIIEPYRRPLVQKLVRYVRLHPITSVGGFSLAAALLMITVLLVSCLRNKFAKSVYQNVVFCLRKSIFAVHT